MTSSIDSSRLPAGQIGQSKDKTDIDENESPDYIPFISQPYRLCQVPTFEVQAEPIRESIFPRFLLQILKEKPNTDLWVLGSCLFIAVMMMFMNLGVWKSEERPEAFNNSLTGYIELVLIWFILLYDRRIVWYKFLSINNVSHMVIQNSVKIPKVKQ